MTRGPEFRLILPSQLLKIAKNHFAAKDNDHWMICNGPTSEIWYTTELIIAITTELTAKRLDWHTCRVMGQEKLSDIGGRHGFTNIHISRPDLTIECNLFSKRAPYIATVGESKLVTESDFSALGWAKKGGILTQLEHNYLTIPKTSHLGFVFVEWRKHNDYELVRGIKCRCKRDEYFRRVSETLTRTMKRNGSKYKWVSNGIETIISQSPPTGQSAHSNNVTALGLGVIRRKLI